MILNVGVGALSILMAATQVTPAFAGSWQNTQSGWNYINDNGSKALGWTQTPSGWYYLDTDSGIMQTGGRRMRPDIGISLIQPRELPRV